MTDTQRLLEREVRAASLSRLLEVVVSAGFRRELSVLCYDARRSAEWVAEVRAA